ncbi:MAG: hypothetical protein JNN08_21570 [Bryobacterales bacterium]|nr:hypothetical protein [Bryobacterales bacterium]
MVQHRRFRPPARHRRPEHRDCPGLVQTDLSLLKQFRLAERHTLEFRTELFNALNRANFRDPGVNIGQPATFGVIQSARPGRIVQFGLKYSF